MALADPKPARRIVDPKVLAAFDRTRECVSCGHGRGVQAHHILGRAQRGDDVPANLVGLCGVCHTALHGSPGRAYGVRIDANHVRQALARYIRSEAGEDARWYLTSKLGDAASIMFLERLEGLA